MSFALVVCIRKTLPCTAYTTEQQRARRRRCRGRAFVRQAGQRPTTVGPPPRPCSVIKIILQFCKENGLTESFNAIQVGA